MELVGGTYKVLMGTGTFDLFVVSGIKITELSSLILEFNEYMGNLLIQ